MRHGRAALAALLCLLLVWPVLAARRVISLAPHATELAYAAGMGEVLVAASDWSDYPPAARRLEQVASWQGVNIERILALKPDLVLGWRGGNPQRVLETLAAYIARIRRRRVRRRARCVTNRRRSRNVMPAAQRCKARSSPCAAGAMSSPQARSPGRR